MRNARMAGLTLIELMVVLVIVAVLLLVAVPSYTTLIERTKLKSYANEFVASVYLARSEAIKRSTDMVLCVSDNGTSCTGGADWEEGWVVLDPNQPPDHPVVKHQEAFDGGIVLFELSSATFTSMTFEPSGVVSTSASMKLCQQTPEAGVEEKLVTVSATGRPRIETTTTGCP